VLDLLLVIEQEVVNESLLDFILNEGVHAALEIRWILEVNKDVHLMAGVFIILFMLFF